MSVREAVLRRYRRGSHTNGDAAADAAVHSGAEASAAAAPGRTWQRRVLRPVVIVPLVAVVAAGTWYFLRSGSSSGSPAAVQRTAVVTSAPLAQTVSASGTLAPTSTQDLNFAVSGQVTAVNVKAGQQVAAGAVLATIDSAALQSQVAQAQSTVSSAQARLSSDETSAASSAQISADTANLNSAEAALASAQSSLADASLTSPIAGTVAVVNLAVGQQLGSSGTSGNNFTGTGTGSGRSTASASAASGFGASSSASSSSPQVEVISPGYVVNLNVDDTQIGRIAVGQQATVTPTSSSGSGAGGFGRFAALFGGGGGGGGGGFARAAAGAGGTGTAGTTTALAAAAPAVVTSVGTIADVSAGVATFPVVVAVTGTPTGFYPGASAQVAITYNQLNNVLQVPSLAITQSNGQSYVTLVVNGKQTRRAVTTGLVSGGQTQITSGVTAGDTVAIIIPTRTGGTGTGGTGRTGTGGTGRTGGAGGAGGFGGLGGAGG